MDNRHKSISLLESANIPFEIIEHSKKVYTCAETAVERKVPLDQVVKTLICYDKRKNVNVFLVAGGQSLNQKKARQHIKSNKLKFVDRSILENDYGLIIGAISPLLMIGKGRLVMDQYLQTKDFLTISSGEPGSGIKLNSQDLIEYLDCEIGDLV